MECITDPIMQNDDCAIASQPTKSSSHFQLHCKTLTGIKI